MGSTEETFLHDFLVILKRTQLLNRERIAVCVFREGEKREREREIRRKREREKEGERAITK